MKLRKLVLLCALAVPVVTWSQTAGTELGSLGNVHYVGVGITTWGNGDIRAQINAAYAALPARGGTIVVIGGGALAIASRAAIDSGLHEFCPNKFFGRDYVGLCSFG